MRQKKQKFTVAFVLIVFTFSLFGLYHFMQKEYSLQMQKNLDALRESTLQKCIENKKKRSEFVLSQLTNLLENTNRTIKPKLKEKLEQDVHHAYTVAHTLYDKYKGKKPKKEIQELIKGSMREVFITNFKGNSILKGNQTIDKKEFASYLDAEYRSTILEEIQKVRRFSEGFLESKRAQDAKQEIIYVKNLDLYDWFIGSIALEDAKRIEAQNKFLQFIQKIPLGQDETLGVISKREILYLSPSSKEKFEHLTPQSKWFKESSGSRYYYTKYYADFDWYLVYSFDSSTL